MTIGEQLTDSLLQSGLLPHEGLLTAALSGGADSVALLCLLHSLAPTCGYTLQAVHVHHGIRGTEADRDAAFCEALCQTLQIPFQLARVDAVKYAKQERLSLETAARLLRYDALERLAPQGLIATAHHAGDQAETMLFHLMRGSGLRGLCGIPQKRGRIIRPLLQIPKETLLSYLDSIGQPFVTDSTNLLTDSTRNQLRHEVMPLLNRCNPQSSAHMVRTAAMLSEDEALLSGMADDARRCHQTPFGGLADLQSVPKPLRMRIYMQILRDTMEIDPSYEQLCAIETLLSADGIINLSGGFQAQSVGGILYFPRKNPPLNRILPLKIGENKLYAESICLAEQFDASHKVHVSFTKSTLDYDKIKGSSCFHQWCNTDRITLPARNFTSSLKSCIQANVPPPARKRLYALYDDCGCIYCEAVGIAARVKPDADTKRFLRLTVQREI